MSKKCICGKDWNINCFNLGIQSINSYTCDTSKIPTDPAEARKYVTDPSNLFRVPRKHALKRK